jgi:hypothetical protein
MTYVSVVAAKCDDYSPVVEAHVCFSHGEDALIPLLFPPRILPCSLSVCERPGVGAGSLVPHPCQSCRRRVRVLTPYSHAVRADGQRERPCRSTTRAPSVRPRPAIGAHRRRPRPDPIRLPAVGSFRPFAHSHPCRRDGPNRRPSLIFFLRCRFNHEDTTGTKREHEEKAKIAERGRAKLLLSRGARMMRRR